MLSSIFLFINPTLLNIVGQYSDDGFWFDDENIWRINLLLIDLISFLRPLSLMMTMILSDVFDSMLVHEIGDERPTINSSMRSKIMEWEANCYDKYACVLCWGVWENIFQIFLMNLRFNWKFHGGVEVNQNV